MIDIFGWQWLLFRLFAYIAMKQTIVPQK